MEEVVSIGAMGDKRTDWSSIQTELLDKQVHDVAWKEGRLQGLNHFGGDDVLTVAMEAYKLYASTNPVSARAFPSVLQLQDEIIASSLCLLGGSPESQGTVTSGGTESIFLALKSARDIAHQRGITKPEIILPSTAHPAFNKHAHYLGMTAIRVGIGGDYRADPLAMKGRITPNTIMLVGSAPCYPYGLFDPITEIAAVANDSNLLMHVDACVGGFQAPFARELGYTVPDFDLSVPGVTSLSADLHKYGFALKGASVVLFKTAALKEASGFAFNDWPRGTYQTDTFSGTRSGGPVAAAWAVMKYLGRDGYLELTKRLMALRDNAMARIAEEPKFSIVGTPELTLFAFTISDHNLGDLSLQMAEHGWILNLINEPPAIQLMMNITHEERVDEFFNHLSTSMQSAASMGTGGSDIAAEY